MEMYLLVDKGTQVDDYAVSSIQEAKRKWETEFTPSERSRFKEAWVSKSNDPSDGSVISVIKSANSAPRSTNPVVANALAATGVARNAYAKSLDKYGSLCKQLQDIGREYRRLNPIVVKEIDALEGNDKEAYKEACRKFNAFSDLVPYHLSDGLVMGMGIPMK